MSKVLNTAMIICLFATIVCAPLSAKTLENLENFTKESSWQRSRRTIRQTEDTKTASNIFRHKIEAILKINDEKLRIAFSNSTANLILDTTPFEYNCTLDMIAKIIARGELERIRLSALEKALTLQWKQGCFGQGTNKVLIIGGFLISYSPIADGVAAKVIKRAIHGKDYGGLIPTIQTILRRYIALSSGMVANVSTDIPTSKFFFYKTFRRNPELVLNPELAQKLLEAIEGKHLSIEIRDIAPPIGNQSDNDEINNRDIQNIN